MNNTTRIGNKYGMAPSKTLALEEARKCAPISGHVVKPPPSGGERQDSHIDSGNDSTSDHGKGNSDNDSDNGNNTFSFRLIPPPPPSFPPHLSITPHTL